jgi:hypothetical protein
VTDDEELRRTRAERLRRKIDEVLRGERPPQPRTPREFTDAAAREAAEEARRRHIEEEEQPGEESTEPEEQEAEGDSNATGRPR